MEQSRNGINKIYRKSWPVDNLFGSSRFELTSSNRGTWNDLLDMAKISRVKPGVIAPAPGQSYSHEWLAQFLNIPLKEFNDAIDRLIETKRIKENHNGIEIINWKRYQPEYERQKPYRDKEKRELSKKELQAQREARKGQGLCELCGESGHNKYNCPDSKFRDMVKRK